MPPDNTPDVSAIPGNKVTIDDTKSRTIAAINYVPNSLRITSGKQSQPPPSISRKDDNPNVWEITLKAERSKSEEVAKEFNKACGGASKEHSKDQKNTPKELNFYFAVTVDFWDAATETIYLGQGSYTGANNWWIGGSAIFSEGGPKLEYRRRDEIVTEEISGTHEKFDLKYVGTRLDARIKHVFVLMLENHSFDNMLAFSGIEGITAATTKDSNSYQHGDNTDTYNFHKGAPDSMPTDPGHEFPDVLEQLAGPGAVYPTNGGYPPINNSGFVANYATSKSEKTGLPEHHQVKDIMGGFVKEQMPILHHLAKNYVVCDHWFSSLPGPTWPNRYFLHGASSNGLDYSPTDEEMVEWCTVHGFHFPHGSIFDRMKDHGDTWRLYYELAGPLEGSLPQVLSIKNITIDDIHEFGNFAADVQSTSNPYQYQYTFIEPNYGDDTSGTYRGGTSQHPMDSLAGGEGMITTIYEALRNSPIWKHCLFIITYDEHGGFYDHVAPGPATAPGDGGKKYSRYGFDFKQYGVRVPAVVISPFIAKPAVDHTIYDHTSILSMLELLFELRPLTERDGAANHLHHLLSHNLRTDIPELPAGAAAPPPVPPLSPEEQAAKDLELIPDGSTLMGLLGVMLKADAEIQGVPAALARFATVKTRGDARVYKREVMQRVVAYRAARGVK